MRKLSLLFLLLPVPVLSCDTTPTEPTPAVDETPSFTIDGERQEQTRNFTFTVFVPCALDGVGEFVDGTGTEIRRRWFFRDPAGGRNIVLQTFIKNAIGFGRTSGDVYRLKGPSTETGHITARGTFTNTESEFLFLIGQGSGSILLRRSANHENTNPNLDEPIEFPLDFVKCL